MHELSRRMTKLPTRFVVGSSASRKVSIPGFCHGGHEWQLTRTLKARQLELSKCHTAAGLRLRPLQEEMNSGNTNHKRMSSSGPRESSRGTRVRIRYRALGSRQPQSHDRAASWRLVGRESTADLNVTRPVECGGRVFEKPLNFAAKTGKKGGSAPLCTATELSMSCCCWHSQLLQRFVNRATTHAVLSALQEMSSKDACIKQTSMGSFLCATAMRSQQAKPQERRHQISDGSEFSTSKEAQRH